MEPGAGHGARTGAHWHIHTFSGAEREGEGGGGRRALGRVAKHFFTCQPPARRGAGGVDTAHLRLSARHAGHAASCMSAFRRHLCLAPITWASLAAHPGRPDQTEGRPEQSCDVDTTREDGDAAVPRPLTAAAGEHFPTQGSHFSHIITSYGTSTLALPASQEDQL